MRQDRGTRRTNGKLREGMMTQAESKKLDTIIGKIEALQVVTKDQKLQDRLQSAKNELIRASRGG
jgi:hypothetical protein